MEDISLLPALDDPAFDEGEIDHLEALLADAHPPVELESELDACFEVEMAVDDREVAGAVAATTSATTRHEAPDLP